MKVSSLRITAHWFSSKLLPFGIFYILIYRDYQNSMDNWCAQTEYSIHTTARSRSQRMYWECLFSCTIVPFAKSISLTHIPLCAISLRSIARPYLFVYKSIFLNKTNQQNENTLFKDSVCAMWSILVWFSSIINRLTFRIPRLFKK